MFTLHRGLPTQTHKSFGVSLFDSVTVSIAVGTILFSASGHGEDGVSGSASFKADDIPGCERGHMRLFCLRAASRFGFESVCFASLGSQTGCAFAYCTHGENFRDKERYLL